MVKWKNIVFNAIWSHDRSNGNSNARSLNDKALASGKRQIWETRLIPNRFLQATLGCFRERELDWLESVEMIEIWGEPTLHAFIHLSIQSPYPQKHKTSNWLWVLDLISLTKEIKSPRKCCQDSMIYIWNWARSLWDHVFWSTICHSSTLCWSIANCNYTHEARDDDLWPSLTGREDLYIALRNSPAVSEIFIDSMHIAGFSWTFLARWRGNWFSQERKTIRTELL